MERVELSREAPVGSVGGGERGLVAPVEEASRDFARRAPGERLVVGLEDVAREAGARDYNGRGGAEPEEEDGSVAPRKLGEVPMRKRGCDEMEEVPKEG